MPADSTPYKIIFASKAATEVTEAWHWYEMQKPGLGDEFTNEVMKCVDKIVVNPLHCSIKTKEFREAIVKRFPFLIVYRIKNKERLIRILSVFHTMRNPNKK